jgi:hypothetical protein
VSAVSYAPGRGAAAPRLNRTVLLSVVAGGLAALLLLAAIAVKLKQPAAPAGPCVGALCPPQPGTPGLISQTVWKSTLGFQAEYDSKVWAVTVQDGTNLKMVLGNTDTSVWIQGFNASQGSLKQLVDTHLGGLGGQVVGLTPDKSPEDAILGPAVGFVDGIGATYQGTSRNGSGPGGQEFVYVVAATDGTASVVISATTTESQYKRRSGLLGYVDTILNYFKFRAEIA